MMGRIVVGTAVGSLILAGMFFPNQAGSFFAEVITWTPLLVLITVGWLTAETARSVARTKISAEQATL
jgi:hypothetical protein